MAQVSCSPSRQSIRAADHFIGNARREFHGGELIGEVRFERRGELLHQDGEIGALVRRRRHADRRPQRLADALPVAVEIVREGAEVTRTAADQPSEDDAAADVLDTPAPLLHRAQDFPGFRREHPNGNLFAEEGAEDPDGAGDFGIAVGGTACRLFTEPGGIAGKFQLLFEDGLIGCQQGLQDELEIFVLKFIGADLRVSGQGLSRFLGIVSHGAPLTFLPPPRGGGRSLGSRSHCVRRR